MQPGDVLLDVDAMKTKNGHIDSGDQHQVTQEKQASTSQYDQTNYKLTSFKDFCDQVADTQMFGKLKAHNVEKHANNQMWTKIQRVPEVMQRNGDFKEYYKPMELSVGPLHAADPNLSKTELKIKLAARFIKESGHTAEDLFEEIKKNFQELKTYFDDREIKSYKDEILARLLFLDGCAVIQFIHSYINKSLNEFSINNGQAELILQDLFLLENQIPFKVLQLLMDMEAKISLRGISSKDSLMQFLLTNNLVELVGPTSLRAHYYLSQLIISQADRKAIHLLDLLQSLLVMDSHDDDRSLISVNLFIQLFWGCMFILCCPCFICLRFCASDCFIDFILSFLDGDWYPQQSFRNVQELKAAGITLKPSASRSLRDISFHKRWFFRGCVELPPLLVDSSTARKMLNLVAYEMSSPNYEENCYVTSYINLIDLLIDDEKDVKLLRSADMLRNRLSTDTQVATLFNRIGSTCLSPPNDTYLGVKSDIESHYKRKLAVWMAQVYHAHFSSPWAILALLAAVTMLLLTAIQTWYAVHDPKKNC